MTIRIDGTNTAANPGITGADTDTGLQFGTDEVNIVTGGSTRATVDSSGNLGVGTASPTDTGGYGRALDIQSDTGAAIYLRTNDDTSQIAQGPSDLTIRTRQAHPIIFNTDNAERARIDSSGNVLINKTSTSQSVVGMQLLAGGPAEITTDGNRGLLINRKTSDGQLVAFDQDGITQGSITVSGSTVSYNGAHLSRWSQLPNGAERTDILRGTVLSNIDEMCEWGEEENEQLNRMKVSDVEGDKNVSGVFQAWDDDDDTYTNDFYCAMTGDFVIRIAQGTTVARGDLLMSAGDGTAKPQDDDIIRSKTIAKVTSTNVSCTYDDGSYCVPCVLMAC